MKESIEQAKDRIMQKIRAAKIDLWLAEDRIKELNAQGVAPAQESILDSLLGCIGCDERSKADRQLYAAQDALKEACDEWDELTTKGIER